MRILSFTKNILLLTYSHRQTSRGLEKDFIFKLYPKPLDKHTSFVPTCVCVVG